MNEEQWEWLTQAMLSIQAEVASVKQALAELPSGGQRSSGDDDDLPKLRPDKAKGDGYWIVSESSPGYCRKCEARIYWHISRKGKKCPIDSSGRFHFDVCKGQSPEATHVPPQQPTYDAPPSDDVPF